MLTSTDPSPVVIVILIGLLLFRVCVFPVISTRGPTYSTRGKASSSIHDSAFSHEACATLARKQMIPVTALCLSALCHDLPFFLEKTSAACTHHPTEIHHHDGDVRERDDGG